MSASHVWSDFPHRRATRREGVTKWRGSKNGSMAFSIKAHGKPCSQAAGNAGNCRPAKPGGLKIHTVHTATCVIVFLLMWETTTTEGFLWNKCVMSRRKILTEKRQNFKEGWNNLKTKSLVNRNGPCSHPGKGRASLKPRGHRQMLNQSHVQDQVAGGTGHPFCPFSQRDLLREKVCQGQLELRVVGSSWHLQGPSGFWNTQWRWTTTNTFLRKGFLFTSLTLAGDGSSFPELTVVLGWMLSSKDFECRRAHVLTPRGGTVTGRAPSPRGAGTVLFTWPHLSPWCWLPYCFPLFPSLPASLLPICHCYSRTSKCSPFKRQVTSVGPYAI